MIKRIKGHRKGAIPLSTIILILVACVFLTIFIGNFFGMLDQEVSEVACHDSLALAVGVAQKLPAGVGTHNVKFPSSCKTIPVIIEEDRKKYVMEYIANLLKDCHEMMGEGAYHPFDKEIAGYEIACYTCYNVDLSELSEIITADEMLTYLQKEKVPKTTTTYAQKLNYLGKIQRDKWYKSYKFSWVHNPITTNLNPKQSYAIVFTGPECDWKGNCPGKGYYKPIIVRAGDSRIKNCLPKAMASKTKRLPP